VGESSSTGLRKGVVVNIEATLRAVEAAISAAEIMSGQNVRTCWAGIGGGHVEGINSRGVVAITGKNRETREIGPDDIVRVLDAARAVPMPIDRHILDVIPQTYIVDSQRGIRDPLDIIGVRLEAEVHIITCSLTSAQNLYKCINRAGFRAHQLVLQSLAASAAVLTEDEKEQGVVLIDLGGGTTDLMVYAQGAPCFTASIPLGGGEVTADIEYREKISLETAEDIKISAGCCSEEAQDGDNDIIVPGLGGRSPVIIPRARLRQTIQPRVEEILLMARDKLAGAMQPVRSVVLTGGGALMPGVIELATQFFAAPVRTGIPLAMGGLADRYQSPEYATAVGLVLEGNRREMAELSPYGPPQPGKTGNVFGRLGDWFRKYFF
jgi:cell division protein FtsA